jgi:chemotaxis protein methyltransferase CheR
MGVPLRAGKLISGEPGRTGGLAADLTQQQFTTICDVLYRITGVKLNPGKEALVRARLGKRLYALGLSGYAEYLELIQNASGGEELARMVDALVTNKTSFFRESPHFDFLRERVRDLEHTRSTLRIWSAGCSTGEEPYSIAIALLQAIPDALRKDILVLATDVSTRALAEARAGFYTAEEVADMEATLRTRYFISDRSAGGERYRVVDEPRSMIRFAHLNLMEAWPMRGPFDFIFCRNVMIYFDRPTQDQLVQRFGQLLRAGGCLMIGHSETLSGRAAGFTYLMPAVYQKQ